MDCKQRRTRRCEARLELFRLVRLAKKGDLSLGCYCKPPACHCDTIKAAIECVPSVMRILLANSVSAPYALYIQSSETHKFFVWRVRQQDPRSRRDTSIKYFNLLKAQQL